MNVCTKFHADPSDSLVETFLSKPQGITKVTTFHPLGIMNV